MINLIEFLNTNKSVRGDELLESIQDRTAKTDTEARVKSLLYYKYVVDREGKSKDKIKPNVYYFVNYNNRVSPEQYLAYIIRDRVKSPKRIPEVFQNQTIVNCGESYTGKVIAEWAYFQNGNSENEFYIEGCDIVTGYLENAFPLKKNTFYFVTKTSKGIKIFRDFVKSPRGEQW